jgi:carbamoyltransferase
LNILGFHCGHDANAAIVSDGVIVAAIEKERLTRRKGDRGDATPCIEYCLDAAGMTMGDIDLVAMNRGSAPGHRRSGTILSGEEYARPDQLHSRHLLELCGRTLSAYSVQHHVAHAAASFFTSPFEEAAILTLDGWGDFTATMLCHGRGNGIRVLRTSHCNVGFVWTAVATTLGLPARYSEGTIMALAALGEPRYAAALFDHCGGDFDWFRVQGRRVRHVEALREIWDGEIDRLFCATSGFDDIRFLDGAKSYGVPFLRDVVDQGDWSSQATRDVAASIQRLTEDAVVYFARELRETTGAAALCLGGGVALNCVANRRALEDGGFAACFVPPAPHDGGLGAGAALYVYHCILGRPRRVAALASAALGKTRSGGEVESAVAAVGRSAAITRHTRETMPEIVAASVADGKVVGWYDGRSEWGPRALGSRSILADPRRPELAGRLNERVKRRESFRPFAPAVLADEASEYFAFGHASPFMSFTAKAHPARATAIPAVLHVDGSARLQTVTDANGAFHEIIQCFRRRTGIPLVLNTSLNCKEPIVETPDDAVRCFLESGIDALAMGEILLSRRID